MRTRAVKHWLVGALGCVVVAALSVLLLSQFGLGERPTSRTALEGSQKEFSSSPSARPSVDRPPLRTNAFGEQSRTDGLDTENRGTTDQSDRSSRTESQNDDDSLNHRVVRATTVGIEASNYEFREAGDSEEEVVPFLQEALPSTIRPWLRYSGRAPAGSARHIASFLGGMWVHGSALGRTSSYDVHLVRLGRVRIVETNANVRRLQLDLEDRFTVHDWQQYVVESRVFIRANARATHGIDLVRAAIDDEGWIEPELVENLRPVVVRVPADISGRLRITAVPGNIADWLSPADVDIFPTAGLEPVFRAMIEGDHETIPPHTGTRRRSERLDRHHTLDPETGECSGYSDVLLYDVPAGLYATPVPGRLLEVPPGDGPLFIDWSDVVGEPTYWDVEFEDDWLFRAADKLEATFVRGLAVWQEDPLQPLVVSPQGQVRLLAYEHQMRGTSNFDSESLAQFLELRQEPGPLAHRFRQDRLVPIIATYRDRTIHVQLNRGRVPKIGRVRFPAPPEWYEWWGNLPHTPSSFLEIRIRLHRELPDGRTLTTGADIFYLDDDGHVEVLTNLWEGAKYELELRVWRDTWRSTPFWTAEDDEFELHAVALIHE